MSKNFKYEIKFNNINDVPEIYVRGKKIKIVNDVNFHWHTANDVSKAKGAFNVKYIKAVKRGEPTIDFISTETPTMNNERSSYHGVSDFILNHPSTFTFRSHVTDADYHVGD